ncbi:unnamed protein product [Prorocentrum cordatum]|uniref:Trichohyalin-plectin-homology domain-containing protein n=1 Tax=Prorocentrum cordatum TaxID=2364126 RepID=A0ABN9VPN6_9DINO|nr:unnamed protein product [Polarella glacialis]
MVAKIMRKRQDEMARRSHLLNPRYAKTHGADLKAVTSQINEKQIVAAAAAEAEADDAKLQQAQEQVLNAIEEAKSRYRRDKQVETVQYSLQNLSKESRREYDLSDPNRLKNARLPKDGIGSDGRELGAAAMTNFQGDLDVKEIQKKQRAMQKEWLAQQVQEKQMRAEAEREAEKQDANEILTSTMLRETIEAVEAQEAQQDRMELLEANKQLAAEKQARKDAKREKEAMIHTRIVDKGATDERLNEVHDYKLNTKGRLIRDEYKRLTYEQEQAIHDANAQIVLEKQAARKKELAAARENDEEVMGACALMDQLQGLAQEQAKERRLRMVAENQAIANMKSQKDAEEKAAYAIWEPSGTAPRLGHGK